MNWIPVASAALGAVIALLATNVTEWLKWRREQRSNLSALRHQTYSRFQAALTDAHEQMRAEARAHHTPQDRSDAVHTAFRISRCYQLRYEIALIASQHVLDQAEQVFQLVRSLRDQLAEHGDIRSPEYKDLRSAYGISLRELQLSMRAELGTERVQLTGGS